MQEKLLLAGGEWRPRALVLAQLLEEGYDVTAVETWDEAELLLRKRALRPDVVVFDLAEEPQPEAALATLARLLAPGRSIVLTAATTLPGTTVRSLGFDRVLVRPYSVADVVRAVADAVRQPPPG